MQHEQPPNPEQQIENSFIETIYMLAGREPMNELGVQEVLCNLEQIELTEAEREAVGNATEAHIQIIHFFYEGEQPEDAEYMEPQYLAEFYEQIDTKTILAHEYRCSGPGKLRYNPRLNVYEDGRIKPTRAMELAKMLGLPPEEREEGFMNELTEILRSQEESEVAPEDDPERFKAATNLLKRFIA